MTVDNRPTRPARWKIISAFASIYLIWGSTYLAMSIAIQSLPPFLMAGSRFLLAGAILYAWARFQGTPKAVPVHWRSAGIIGALLLLGGNGGVVYSLRFVPTGVAALLVATVPLWMVILQTLWEPEQKPSPSIWAGILLGFTGICILASPTPTEIESVPFFAAVLLLFAALSWALGSLLTRRLPLPQSSSMTIGMEMIAGGICLLAASALTGEFFGFNPAYVSKASWNAFAYLTLLGSLVGFSCYIWIVKVTPPALSSTYAYVNPAVAVFLGWAFAGEPLTPRLLTGTAVIVAAVFLITTRPRTQNKRI